MIGLASHLNDFREQASLGQDAVDVVLSKRFVVALEFVNRQDLFDDVFGEESRKSLDWDCVNGNLDNGSLGTPLETLIAALQLVTFRQDMTPAEIAERSRESPLAFMLEAVQDNAELRGLEAQHVYRMHVLINQMTIFDKLHAVEIYTSLALRRATVQPSTQLMARLASRKFRVDHYHNDFVTMFRDCAFHVDTLRRCDVRASAPSGAGGKSHSGVGAGAGKHKTGGDPVFAGRRPCLLEIIQHHRKESPAVVGALASNADGANTFDSFCNYVPFHASLSARSRKLVYFLASQPHIPVLDHIQSVTGFQSTREFLKSVSISHPQASVITDVLLSLRYTGEPFPALQAFHNECIRNYFSGNCGDHNWTVARVHS